MFSASLADVPLRLFTREEYHAMADAGILTEKDRVELIKGRIVPMMPIGPWHVSISIRLDRLLQKLYGDYAFISTSNPVGLDGDSEPQPDITVLRFRADYYSSGIPTPSEILLIIEVADTSRAFDLGTKHDLYAEQGIPEFWVVDRKMAGIHVFRKPRDGVFTETRLYGKGEEIPLPDCGETTFRVDDSGV